MASSRLQGPRHGARRQHRHSCNARAQGQIPDTSDSAIQELARAERSERAKTPYNIVFVTSEASSILSFGLHSSSEPSYQLGSLTVLTASINELLMHLLCACRWHPGQRPVAWVMSAVRCPQHLQVGCWWTAGGLLG